MFNLVAQNVHHQEPEPREYDFYKRPSDNDEGAEGSNHNLQNIIDGQMPQKKKTRASDAVN